MSTLQTSSRPVYTLAWVGALLLILSGKLLLIAQYGSPVPFWDQWDGEAANLYLPYLTGTLSWGNLFAAHNEHRIFFTRLLSLGLLELAGEWQPLLQMVVNAILHCFAIAVFLWAIVRRLPRPHAMFVVVLSGILFALPIGWENTLAGFQSQFYFLLLFSSASIALAAGTAGLSWRWLISLVLAGAAFFSMASGAFTVLTIAGLYVVQMVVGVRPRTLREIAATSISLVIAGAMFYFVPNIPGHEPLKAHSISQFLGSLTALSSFPLGSVVGSVIVVGPLISLLVLTLRARSATKDRAWIWIGFSGWLAAQMVSIAYGRAVGTLASRYLDLILLAVPLSAVAMLAILSTYPSQAKVLRGTFLFWLFVVGLGVAYDNARFSIPGAQDRGAMAVYQEASLKAYVATRDISLIQNQPQMHIPYPDAGRLADILSHPEIRGILPSTIRSDENDHLAVLTKLRLNGALGQVASAIWSWSLKLAALICGLSLVMLLLALAIVLVPREDTPGLTQPFE